MNEKKCPFISEEFATKFKGWLLLESIFPREFSLNPSFKNSLDFEDSRKAKHLLRALNEGYSFQAAIEVANKRLISILEAEKRVSSQSGFTCYTIPL